MWPDKKQAIKMACEFWKYRWPVTLGSGVMFYEGHKITLTEFLQCSDEFLRATGR